MKPMRSLRAMVAALALLGGACSSGTSESDGGVGNGGQPGSGGATGSGGKVGSGGATGSGGKVGSGGATGSGGDAGAGGKLGSGGVAGAGGTSGSGGAGNPVPSTGCGKTPSLKNSPSTPSYNKLTSGGGTRQYLLRWPTSYDNTHPYRLILGLHGATGNGSQVGPGYFGIFDLSQGSTIFVAPDAVGGFWDATKDVTLVDDVLTQVEADLCIDKSRIELEGFSQGGAMAYTLVCARPGIFRAAVAHSPGGLALPKSCSPVAYFTSLGQQENTLGQTMTADFFAKVDGCTVESLPKAPTGGHLCSSYKSCSDGHPVRWCPYDGGHTPSPTDSGQSKSWMPQEVWTWLSQF